MKVCVYVQSNLNSTESTKVEEAAKALGLPFIPFKLTPFTDRMPKLGASPNSPFLLLGSTTLVRNAYKSRKYKKGLFFDNNNFSPSLYVKKFGKEFLNWGMEVFTLQELPTHRYGAYDRVFVRSNDDSKSISGGVILYKDLLDVRDNAALSDSSYISGDLFCSQSEICVSSVKEIYNEYRVIVSDNQIVGYSRYRPSPSVLVPEEVLDYAKKVIDIWQPHRAFVIDIAYTPEGFKVIECNCVNASGWYAADYKSILSALADSISHGSQLGKIG